MSDHQKAQKSDPFLLNYNAEEVRIAAEFLSNWLPFLTRGLCKSCTQTLSDGIQSLYTGENLAGSMPGIVDLNQCKEDQGNCSGHSTGSMKDSADNNDDGETHSLGSWKDEGDALSEPTSESSSLRTPASPTVKKSWADMALEDELIAEEENEVSSRAISANDPSAEGTSMNEVKQKVALSRDQREYFRFGRVQRKKDFICLERVNGRIVNILDGLELHKGVFSAAEQKRITSYVEELQEMGRNGQLKLGAGEFAGSYAISLPVGSVLVINGNGADVAKHCVPAVPSKRMSITFRRMDESKRPSGYVPEPDLQGLQPLSDEEYRSNNNNASRPRRSFRRLGNGRDDRMDRGRQSTAEYPDARYSGRTRQGPPNRRRYWVNLEN
ncbi:hypothetical protein CDL12_18520 [Handroanthus impetiginosus]|uniref:Uncharacterized protein n=1 Tax=Handroanthus impetiginosus TaxID=429701 RepID=A0A2G9GUF7_9LAMI|nr:hypothetical protein CDL12_18520 [Handroanthus impetiginosus]